MDFNSKFVVIESKESEMNIQEMIEEALQPLRESYDRLKTAVSEFAESQKAAMEKARIEAIKKRYHVDTRTARMVDPASVDLNERARGIAKEQKIEFGEALQIAAEASPPARAPIPVDAYSVALDLRSQHLVKERKMEYAEALELAGQEFFESGLTPGEIGEMFGPDHKDPSTEDGKKQIQKIMLVYGVSEPTATHLFKLGTKVG